MRDLLARLELAWRAWRYRLRLDAPEIRYLLGNVAPGTTAIDVGAHKGGYTYWLQRAVGRAGHVYAFEPQPELARGLARALAASGIRNVTVEALALSDRSGEVVMTLPRGRSTCGATLQPRPGARASFTVRATTLDEYFARVPGPIGFLKCDVEGHELSVFRGAERLLATHHPILMFECEMRHTRPGSVWDVFRHLEARGYAGWFFRRGALIPVSEFDAEKLQRSPDQKPYVNNFLFTPAAVAGAPRRR